MKKRPSPLTIIVIIIAVLIGLVSFYLECFHVYYPLDGNVYRTEEVRKNGNNENEKFYLYLIFKDGKMYNLFTDEYHTSACYRMTYDYTTHTWLSIGPVHFRTNSILSATTEKFNGTPITLTTKCTESRGFNMIEFVDNGNGTYSLLDEPYFYTFDYKDDVGVRETSLIVANDFGLVYGNTEYQKIDENNSEFKVITELTRLYLDNESIFRENYDASFSS